MAHEHPDDFDSPWKEALEQALPDFLALFFPEAHAGIDWRAQLRGHTGVGTSQALVQQPRGRTKTTSCL